MPCDEETFEDCSFKERLSAFLRNFGKGLGSLPGDPDTGIGFRSGALLGQFFLGMSTATKTLSVAAGGTRTFYRGVSHAELADVQATGALRSVTGAEGKYLAASAADAAVFGERALALTGESLGGVIRVQLTRGAARDVTALGRIDGIGEAFFAPLSSLTNAKITIVP